MRAPQEIIDEIRACAKQGEHFAAKVMMDAAPAEIQLLIDQAREEGRREGANLVAETFTTDYGDVARMKLRLPHLPYPDNTLGVQQALSRATVAAAKEGKAKFLRYIAERMAYMLGKHFDVDTNSETTP